MDATQAPTSLDLTLLPQRLAVCWLDPGAALPTWATQGALWSVTRTAEELSVVCAEADVPGEVRREGGWRALMVAGPLDFTLVGVLLSVAAPLAAAGVSIFAISTYDTDYVLVRATQLDHAIAALRAAGHRVAAPTA
jgi:hypothetical protein